MTDLLGSVGGCQLDVGEQHHLWERSGGGDGVGEGVGVGVGVMWGWAGWRCAAG